MKLLFSGTISPFWVILLFVVAVVITLVLYKRHNLPQPWRFLLPALRILALALLLLMLLQPVLARFHDRVIQGQIPILVDTSGSMDTVDDYPKHRQVEIGYHLELFSQDLRNMTFVERAAEISMFQDAMAAAEAEAAEMRSTLDGMPAWSDTLRTRTSSLGKTWKALGEQLRDMADKINEDVAESEYLQEEPEGGAQVVWEIYTGQGGSSLRDLLSMDEFPDRPDDRWMTDTLASPRNKLDNYGLRARGLLIPPADGNYEFMFTSDDEGELWLSPDSDPKRMRKVLSANVGTARGGERKLRKGQPVFFEVRMKEGAGDDYAKVGWTLPGGKEEMPIPGSAIASYPYSGASFAAKFGPVAQTWELESAQLVSLAKFVEEARKNSEKEDKKSPDVLLGHLGAFADVMESLREQPKAEVLQRYADEALADAGIAEVDEALASLAEMKRSDLARYILQEAPVRLTEELDGKGEVKVFSFEENPEPIEQGAYTNKLVGELPVTRMGSSLKAVMNLMEKTPVAGVVLVSDGNNNAGSPVFEVKESLEEREIPVYALAMGSVEPPDDVSIARVSAPRTSFLEDTLNLNVALHRHGYGDKPIKVKVMAGEEVMAEKEVPPGGDDELVLDMSFTETNGGVRTYHVEVEGFGGEAFDHNNQKAVSVNVLEDRIKTLVVDEFPRWETRYANMMLSRDKRVDLTTVFVASTKDGSLPIEGTEAAKAMGSRGYPDSRDSLFSYQLIFLGDVNPRHFTRAQLEDLRDFVVERGGTLIAMAGEHHMPYAYQGTPMSGLIPLRGMGRAGAGEEAAVAATSDDVLAFKEGRFQPKIGEETAFEDVIQIGPSPDGTIELWSGLPELNWVQDQVNAARSADTIVSAESTKGVSRGNQAPLMVKAFVGTGKVLYLGSDSFWRWRYRARWTYHHRFWGQILLWATMGRTTGSDPNCKLMADRPLYAPEEPVVFKARLLDERDRPLTGADGALEVYDEEDGFVKRVPLIEVENSGGEYRAEIRDLERGAYTVVPKVQELDHLDVEADVKIEIRDLPTSEYVDLAVNQAALRELTPNVLPFERALALADQIEDVSRTERERTDTELWASWPYLLLIALILAIEWMLRKRLRLA